MSECTGPGCGHSSHQVFRRVDQVINQVPNSEHQGRHQGKTHAHQVGSSSQPGGSPGGTLTSPGQTFPATRSDTRSESSDQVHTPGARPGQNEDHQVRGRMADQVILDEHQVSSESDQVYTLTQTSKIALHRKMRSLGMGKHANGSAHTLANHKRVPDAVTVGEGKTLGQYKSERKEKKRHKNKMARKSRARNRR